MQGRVKMCDPDLGRAIIAFLSFHDLDFGVDYAVPQQKVAGSGRPENHKGL